MSFGVLIFTLRLFNKEEHFSFKIRVGHFEPEEICLTGEGVFPRIILDLPRDIERENFKRLVEIAKQNLANVEKLHGDDDVFMENFEVHRSAFWTAY